MSIGSVRLFGQPTGGIGAGLALDGEVAVIRQLLPDSAAGKDGLKEGDRIVEVGQAEGPMVSGKGMPSSDFIQLIRGPVGSPVRLKIVPDGGDESKARIVTVTRAGINPLAQWCEPAGAKVSTADQTLPAWVVPRLAPMRTLGTYLALLPPDYETSTKTYPVVVLVHGTGDSERGFGRIVTDLGREGIIYLAMRAPYTDVGNTISNRGPSFTAWPTEQLPDGDPTFMVARRDCVDWLFDAVADARKSYRIQPGRVTLYGFSQGGGIVTSAALIYPERVQLVFSISGSTPPEQLMTTAALQQLKDQRVHLVVIEGKEDQTEYVARTTAFAERLKTAGVVTDFHLVPGKHEIPPDMYRLSREWLAKEVR